MELSCFKNKQTNEEYLFPPRKYKRKKIKTSKLPIREWGTGTVVPGA